MIKNCIVTLMLSLTFLASPCLAMEVKNVASSQAEGRSDNIPAFQVWAGVGLNLNFVATGEYITKVWLDDPSRLVLDFEVPIDSGKAQIIHIRRIEAIEFEKLPATPFTVISVVTTNSRGEKKLYNFQLGYGTGKPQYVAVNVNGEVNRQETETARARLVKQENEFAQIERLEKGLAIAIANNQSEENEAVFRRIRMMITYLKTGMSATESANRANLSPSVIKQLEQLANQDITSQKSKAKSQK